MSKLHLPLLETFFWRKYFCGRKVAINDFCDKKKCVKTFASKILIQKAISYKSLKLKKKKLTP